MLKYGEILNPFSGVEFSDTKSCAESNDEPAIAIIRHKNIFNFNHLVSIQVSHYKEFVQGLQK